MAKELARHKEGDMQDKILDVAMNFFAPNQNNSHMSTPQMATSQTHLDTGVQTQLESGVQYSDDQIIGVFDAMPPSMIQYLKGVGQAKVTELIKSKVPNISEESIKRSHEILECWK
jgi:hypothetical protein